MSNEGKPKTSVDEFRDFTNFLKNLWGILAGVSILFPLSNVLIQVIPLGMWPEGGLAYFPPALVTILATLASLFFILWTFGQRNKILAEESNIRRQAMRSFLWGIAALVVYLLLAAAVRADFYSTALGWNSGDLQRVFGDVILLVAYAAFFALVTRAFVLLGLIEFMRRKRV